LPQDGNTPLHLAAAQGALGLVQFLLAEGADTGVANQVHAPGVSARLAAVK
jgi:ankyrin repeat protein